MMEGGGHSRAGVLAGTRLRLAAACVAALLCVVSAGAEEPPATGAAQSVEAASAQPVASMPAWRVIVHPANTIRSMTREELERIYRRRNRFWPDRSTILPLNLPGSDPLRRSFSADVLHDNEEELATFWNRQYFQGIAPPAVLHSTKAVRAYVAATPNAIGYVSADDVDASVAVVEVTHGQ